MLLFLLGEYNNMDNYVTGNTIFNLRNKLKLTQKELADQLFVSDKTVSKWETGKGFPDISLIEPLAEALHVSTIELLSGNVVNNVNISSNLIKSKFYVCPVCGNIIHSVGDAVISCCGIALPPLELEDPDDMHDIQIVKTDGEHYLTINHDMTKSHYISFVAFVSGDKCDVRKLYPEGNAECRLNMRGHGYVYYYCNLHGLFRKKV